MAQIVILKRAHHFSLDNDIFDVHARTIGPMATLVYTALARYANRKTGECWPSIGRLAHLLALARNTVKTALRTLEAAGLIAIKRRRDPAGDATSHLYTLLDPTPQAVEARLARRTAAALAADEGRAGDDPPPGSCCPTGRAALDPEPQDPPTIELNQAGAAHAAEDTPATTPRPPCPHPIEERSHYSDIAICRHCWTLLAPQAEPGPGASEPGEEEGQAHCATDAA
jgi:DNA-binding MarR family transcriptional regulator